MSSANGHTEVVKLLLQDSRVNPSAEDNYAIWLSSKNTNTDDPQVYIPFLPSLFWIKKQKQRDSNADIKDPMPTTDSLTSTPLAFFLLSQCYLGNLTHIKTTLEESKLNTAVFNKYAIRITSKLGYVDVVNFLLQDSRVDPSDKYDDAIQLASENGHTEVVKLLLQDTRVDPSANNNYAIR